MSRIYRHAIIIRANIGAKEFVKRFREGKIEGQGNSKKRNVRMRDEKKGNLNSFFVDAG